MSGLRVVRGPDWRWNAQDGGESHVGTIVFPKDTDELKTNTAFVNWDKGLRANYRTGLGNKYDLLVFDSAPLGIKHNGVQCDACNTVPVYGMRWKCTECHDYDLCHSCYMSDEHDKNHIFCRHDAPHLDGVPVSKRAGAVKCQAWGTFEGATVVRGSDWHYGDQDGGKGKLGKVVSIINWKDDVPNSGAKVTWPSGTSNNYRVGFGGKVDVEYDSESSGGFFYRDHLPKFDMMYHRVMFPVGGSVKVRDLPIETFRRLQQDRCGWQDTMISTAGKDGTVVAIAKDGDIKVETESSGCWFYNPICLEAADGGDDDGDAGDLVRALIGMALAERLARDLIGGGLGGGVLGAGGANSVEAMIKAVAQGDTDGLKRLLTQHPDWIDRKAQDMSALHVAAHQGQLECIKILVKAGATMNLRDKNQLTPLHFSVIGKEPNATELLLNSGCTVDAADKNGLTSLHLCALHGQKECAHFLLQEMFFCDRNAQDKDGDTALHCAIVKDERSMINLLVHDNQTDFKICNKRGFNALQWASLKDNDHAVQRIVDKCPTIVDYKMADGGHAPLHIASINGHTNVAKILIVQGNADVNTRNAKMGTPLHLAVEKGMTEMIELLVQKGANVNAQDEDGDTALHVLQIKESGRQLMGNTLLGLLVNAASGGRGNGKEKAAAIGIYLIKNGADINIKNKKQMSILDCIIDPEIEAVVKAAHQDYRRRNQPAEIGKEKKCIVM
ncbi:E3 ubiquitin-protein ligase MIB2-like [Anneissia japonica]|uniref:E3 ubiquitin-protein ligase MIB2-like n=1 Tax=Anneissia japonica TaxID=1529436 RepID=UPI0014256D30|nr:E3 ubiquitin-protein ligase MIB2-like [Anneissia japonica]